MTTFLYRSIWRNQYAPLLILPSRRWVGDYELSWTKMNLGRCVSSVIHLYGSLDTVEVVPVRLRVTFSVSHWRSSVLHILDSITRMVEYKRDSIRKTSKPSEFSNSPLFTFTSYIELSWHDLSLPFLPLSLWRHLLLVVYNQKLNHRTKPLYKES